MMRPLVRPSALWHPLRRRRFDAALTVLLGIHSFRRLSQEDRARVEDRLSEQCKRLSYPYSFLRENIGDSSDFIGGMRARAMAQLGMPTGVAGLAWADFLCSTQSFRRFDAATQDAANYLRENGVELDEDNAELKDWMDEKRGNYPGVARQNE